MLRAAGLLALVLALGACGADEDEPAATPPETANTGTPSSPAGVPVTDPGTELAFGEAATVAWQPTASLTGVLEITVEQVAEQRPAVLEGWLRDDVMKSSRPYFVTVSVANAGSDDLGEQQVPVYLRDDEGRLDAPWTVGASFEPCQSGPLPESFAAGDRTRKCLLYLVPDQGEVEDLVFQPSQSFEPIAWTGEVSTPGTRRAEQRRDKREDRRDPR